MDELVKVLDFGISKVKAAAGQISQAVDLLGTPYYMSPEQARGHALAVDGRTDQFALGAIAYRMLTGQEPFRGDDSAAVLYQVVHEDPPPLSLFLPPSWDAAPLQAVLDRALAKQPERRFGGMSELARAFDDAAERTIGAAGPEAARADHGVVPKRLDDAALDTPPPVRTPTPDAPAQSAGSRPSVKRTVADRAFGAERPVVVRPPRRLPTPPPAAAPKILDWELPSGVDEVPVTRTRKAVLGLLLLAIAGTLIATGWYRKLPAAASGLRQRIHEWTRPSGESSQPSTAPQSQAPAEIAPPQQRPAGADSTDEAPAPSAAENPAAPAPGAGTRAQAPAPAAAAAPTAAPEKPRADRRRAVRNHRQRAPRFAPPPAARPAAPVEITPPASPPLDGRAFEIAPPKAIDQGRDLAPPAVDDTLPPSR
jgi:serine/threonine-protein kinase